jgi:hypothetical protein
LLPRHDIAVTDELHVMVWIGLTSTYDDDSAWTVNIKPSYDNGLALQGYTPVHSPMPCRLR